MRNNERIGIDCCYDDPDKKSGGQGERAINKIFRNKRTRKGALMDTWHYEVVSIDGDYANLRRTDIETDDLKLVALALLPPEIVEGSRLKYEMMEYTLEW